MAQRTRKFARRLAAVFPLEVILWDERYSSAEADRRLGDARRRTREERDAVAAQIILQSYLDSLAAASDPGPEDGA
jgi:putative Holliday junction resolvase